MRSVAFDVIGEGGRAEHQHQVAAGEGGDDPLAHRRQEAGELRMVLGEAAARRHRRGEDARPMALGQGPDLLPGAAAVDAGADDERRPLARIERVADRGEDGRVAARREADAPRLDRRAGAGPVVGRDRDQHRAARRLHREVVAVGDRLRHVFGPGRLAAPLDVGLGQLGRLRREQERVEREQRSRLLAGGDDERRAVLPRGEDRAHRVADADRRVQVDEGGVVRRRRVAVGHADHDRFLQAEDVFEVGREVEEERQLGRARVAEDALHAERAQQLQHRIANGRGNGSVMEGGGAAPLETGGVARGA